MFQKMLQGGSGGGEKYVIKDVTFNNIVTGDLWNTVTFNNTLDFTPKEVISVEVLTATWSSGTGKCYVVDYSCSGNNLNVSVLKNTGNNTVTITYRIICSLSDYNLLYKGIPVFIGSHPHNSNAEYKLWEYNSLDSEYCSYNSSNKTIDILKDFNAYIRYEWFGASNASLEINGEQVTPVNQKLNLIERELKAGDIIKHIRTNSTDNYNALIGIVAR